MINHELTMNRIVFLILLAVLFTDCNKSTEDNKRVDKIKIDSLAVTLNQRGVKIIVSILGFDSLENVLKYQEALQLFDNAIVKDIRYISAYENKTRTLLRLGKIEAALKVTERILKIDSSLVEVISVRGFIYEKMGDHENARKCYNLAIDNYKNKIENLNEEDLFLIRNYTFILVFGKSKSMAIEELERFKKNSVSPDRIEEMILAIETLNVEEFIRTY